MYKLLIDMKNIRTLSIFINIFFINILLFSCKKQKDNEQVNNTSSQESVKTDTQFVRDPNKYYIYLTFDDGPQPPGTLNCKKILEETGTKGTFFMLGQHKEQGGRRTIAIADSINNNPLFLVANHSYSHGFNNKYKKFYSMPDSAVSDFIRAEKVLQIKKKIIRFPGMNTWILDGKIEGQKTPLKVAQKLDSIGYSATGWDLEWFFVRGSTPKQGAVEMVENVKNMLLDGYSTREAKSIVILTHDRMFGKEQYADTLRKFINLLKQDNRFVFETIDNYPGIK